MNQLSFAMMMFILAISVFVIASNYPKSQLPQEPNITLNESQKPLGMLYDGEYIWITDDEGLYKYSRNGTYIETLEFQNYTIWIYDVKWIKWGEYGA